MRTIIVMLFLALCGCVTLPASAPIDTSISEIQKDPWAWHGKTVRVRGTFDECLSFTCQICESEEELKSYNTALIQSESGNRSSFDELVFKCMSAAFVDRAQEALVRFSTSIITAKYDASCSRTNQSEDVIVLCTDRASVLRESRIEIILRGRTTREGVINVYGVEPLLRPDDTTAALIRAAFTRFANANAIGVTAEDFVFQEDLDQEALDYYGVSARGGLCQCKASDCSSIKWPRRSGDTWISNPLNPYTCWSADLTDGVWSFPSQ